ncbi:MAG: hypothetical protein Kow0099_07810 [Candidatus Abyssubacteria bacterium]
MGARLKVDLHTHSADDPEEPIRHTSCELIDKAHSLGYDAISITSHNGLTYNAYLRDYARERGILLIPGVELDIERKHVLVVNAHEGVLAARTFEDLRRLRTAENLIVAPHPYHPGWASLMGKLRRNIDVFDGIEFSWFYHSRVNFNFFAIRTAARYGLPLLCTSDCHHLENFGCAYSLVEAEKDAEAIVEAIKAGRVEIAANPLKLAEIGKHGLEHLIEGTFGMLRKALSGETR